MQYLCQTELLSLKENWYFQCGSDWQDLFAKSCVEQERAGNASMFAQGQALWKAHDAQQQCYAAEIQKLKHNQDAHGEEHTSAQVVMDMAA